MTREKALRVVLILLGLTFLVGLLPLMILWPTGWRWLPYHPAYEHMIVAVYATLGAFLLWASRAPEKHRSLILFTGWSSLLHGAVMAIHALQDTAERGHLVGDVPGILIAGVLLLLLAPPRDHSVTR